MTRHAVIIVRAGSNDTAHVPDLPGCVATAPALARIEREIRDTVRCHWDGLKEDGRPAPVPSAVVEYLEA